MTSAAASEQPTTSATTPRFQWLDILRGAALPAMASYHFMWDLADFGYLDPDFPSTGWPKIYARAIASTFLFLAGFSLVLAHRNGIRWKSFWIRFAKIAGAAVLVSVATYFAMPQGWIFFGILHAIAVASLIGLLFLRAPPLLTIIVAIILIAVPQFYRFEQLDAPWFWWIGLSTRFKISFDYVPLLPWLGPFLIGMAASRISLSSGWLQKKSLGISTTNPLKTFFVALGRHSLVFYIVHQPVLIAMLYVFSLAVPAPKVDPGPHYIRSCVQTCKTGQTEEFCARFCGCTLEKLNALDMLEPLQSGAISVDNDERLNGIAMQCTAESE